MWERSPPNWKVVNTFWLKQWKWMTYSSALQTKTIRTSCMFQTPLCPAFPYVSVLICYILPFFTSKYNKLFWADISSIRPSWWNIFQMFLLLCIFLSPQGLHTLFFHVSQHLPLSYQSMSSGPLHFFAPPPVSLYLITSSISSIYFSLSKIWRTYYSVSLCSEGTSVFPPFSPTCSFPW